MNSLPSVSMFFFMILLGIIYYHHSPIKKISESIIGRLAFIFFEIVIFVYIYLIILMNVEFMSKDGTDTIYFGVFLPWLIFVILFSFALHLGLYILITKKK